MGDIERDKGQIFTEFEKAREKWGRARIPNRLGPSLYLGQLRIREREVLAVLTISPYWSTTSLVIPTHVMPERGSFNLPGIEAMAADNLLAMGNVSKFVAELKRLVGEKSLQVTVSELASLRRLSAKGPGLDCQRLLWGKRLEEGGDGDSAAVLIAKGLSSALTLRPVTNASAIVYWSPDRPCPVVA